ncbi:MAG: hypothetical protein GY844_08260 [Bradyrhizobium sp.]|nr:hypothetical protein [Bradyrhizobium sp.]
MDRLSPAATTTPAATRKDAYDELTFLGRRGGLVAIVAGMVLSFVLFGYAVIYWRNADMDFMVIYNALAMNDGKPQHFFDHTAYLTILTVKYWFQLLHALGLLDAWSLSSIPPASDVPAFDAAMTQAVHAGRILALLIAMGSVLIFLGLMRAVVRDWRVALMATNAFAFSGGVAVHSRILRSEFVAAMPVIFALLTMIAVGRRASSARPLAIGLAAALCILGLENKVQAILLIGVLPLVILPFGSPEGASTAFWRGTPAAWLATALAAVAAGLAASAAWPLIVTGFDRALLEVAHFRPLLLGRYGVYQVALIAMTGGCMIAYAAIWRVSAAETLASMFAMIAAASIALLLLNLHYDPRNVIAVANPLEKMLTFADDATTGAASASGPLAMVALLLEGLGSVLARYTFLLHPSARPTVFLSGLIVAGIVMAWRRGERLAAIQATVLLLAAIGIDTIGVRRGLKSEYFIFTDPLMVLAGAILLVHLTELRFARFTYAVGTLLLVLHLIVGQAEPAKHAFKVTGPEPICEWNRSYMPLLPVPWCPNPS